MRKSWLWTLSGMGVLVAVSFALFLWLRPPTLSAGMLYGNGQIEATEVTVSSEVTARVLESNLTEGRTVQAGEVLVRLDETDLNTRAQQAEAQMRAVQRANAQIGQQLSAWRHHLQTAEADLARYRTLRDAGTVSAQAMDKAQNQYQEARGQVGALEAQLAQTAANLEAAQREEQLLRAQLAKAVIRAPSAGTVLSKGIEPGELTAPGRAIAVLADLARLELRVYIPEADLGKIKLNDPARVRVDAFPERTFEARVARVDARAQFTPKDVHMPDERARLVFGVILAVDNPQSYLKPGMPADAWIRWQPDVSWPDKLSVPR
ncbi:MAG: HlyD family efflux transporter periplasmic adaptor subunit [Gammaproteobacteria bacterium]|nr:HlyD family efflux transporter periplasmic adaptor subunit [Gammaproteobacteria bacterium]